MSYAIEFYAASKQAALAEIDRTIEYKDGPHPAHHLPLVIRIKLRQALMYLNHAGAVYVLARGHLNEHPLGLGSWGDFKVTPVDLVGG